MQNTEASHLRHYEYKAYRYIVPVKNQRENLKITDIQLVQANKELTLEDLPGYDGMSSDLYRGLPVDYLYLVWKGTKVAL